MNGTLKVNFYFSDALDLNYSFQIV